VATSPALREKRSFPKGTSTPCRGCLRGRCALLSNVGPADPDGDPFPFGRATAVIVLGIAAALVSAATQASAHVLLKAGRDKLAVRGLIAATCSLAVAPMTFFVALPSAELWRWLLLAGLLHTIYQFVLVAAYDAADFAVAFPLARGLVPVSTAAAGVLLLGDRLGVLAVFGIVAVTIGLALITYRAEVGRVGLSWAVLAGLLTTTYTVVDSHAVRVAATAATFIVWFFIMDGILMVPLVSWLRRGSVVALARAEGRRGLIAGLASLATYGSALLALRLLPVGGASALRETSVVFGVLMARFTLAEKVISRRLLASVVIAVGGMLVAIGLTRPG
jgi:drug/metabolite transporter (DMT)-like permease